MTAAAQDEEDCGGVAAACLRSCIGGGWRPQQRWSRAKMVSAAVADGSAAGGWWAAKGWFVGLGWWLMAFFLCVLWVVVAGFSSSWCGASTVAKIDRWGLLVVGSKGFGWRVTFWWLDTCGYWEMVFWCGLAEMSWRDFEGGVVAGFLVVENIRWKFFFFFLFGSGLTCDDASNGLVFALIPKLT